MKDKHGNPVPLRKQLDVPPVWLIGCLILSWLIGRFDPFSFFANKPSAFLIFMIAFGLAFWSFYHFRTAQTPVHPRRKPTHLITDGPFRFSRNPIYLAMVMILIGAALYQGSLLSYLVPLLFGWIITRRFIKGEEFHIEKAFGEEWRAYAGRVRRWL